LDILPGLLSLKLKDERKEAHEVSWRTTGNSIITLKFKTTQAYLQSNIIIKTLTLKMCTVASKWSEGKWCHLCRTLTTQSKEAMKGTTARDVMSNYHSQVDIEHRPKTLFPLADCSQLL
jgi:hypothetical protein